MKINDEIVGKTTNDHSEVVQLQEERSAEQMNDIEYTASLLKELKMIADQSGHQMLYHLINMSEMEANSIIQQKQNKKIDDENK